MSGLVLDSREVERMARLTKAQKIEQDNELLALDFFEAALSGLPDPRRPQGVRYPLPSVVVVALMATVCGWDEAPRPVTKVFEETDKGHGRKVGVATARKRAGWDRNSLIELLTSAE